MSTHPSHVLLDKLSIPLYIIHRTYHMYKRYTIEKGTGSMERQMGVTEARKQLARIVDEVKYKGENYIIIRHGQPAAAVVPMEVYRRWKQEREELFGVIREIQAANADADPDQVMREVLDAQQSVRPIAAE